jgi:hypothetical protein
MNLHAVFCSMYTGCSNTSVNTEADLITPRYDFLLPLLLSFWDVCLWLTSDVPVEISQVTWGPETLMASRRAVAVQSTYFGASFLKIPNHDCKIYYGFDECANRMLSRRDITNFRNICKYVPHITLPSKKYRPINRSPDTAAQLCTWVAFIQCGFSLSQ